MRPSDPFQETFREEAEELLSEFEAAMLALEEHPRDAELIGRAFRAIHTVKGSGAMFGFDDLASFAHELETALACVRDGSEAVTRELVSLALSARDEIRALLRGVPLAETRCCEIAAALAQRGAPPPAVSSPEGRLRPCATYRIRFIPGPGLAHSGIDSARLQDELRALGTCVVTALDRSAAQEHGGAPEGWEPWEAVLSTRQEQGAVEAVFVLVRGDCEVTVSPVDPREPGAPSRREPAGPGSWPKDAVADSASSMRVGTDKLDGLVDLVGELVIAQARLSQLVAAGRRATRGGFRGPAIQPALVSLSEDIARLTANLRDTTLKIRLLPIGTMFGKFRRLVRDLAGELGKDAELVAEGGETELDKTVIDRLADPLVHLIRNAVDHGLETTDARIAAGKPQKGTVRLSAHHSGASVFVEIQDDGAGLDRPRLLAKAVERGLVAADAEPGDKELFALIFLPGFSTARAVSNVSGRGVGMDVVKRSIEALRGSIEIESRPGAGTTFRIELPLTLTIIDGLLVAVGQENYVVPLSLVEECVDLTVDAAARAHGRRLVPLRGELVPYLRLRECLGIAGEMPKVEQIVVVSAEGFRFGFAVDRVVGQYQTVTKPLGKIYRNVQGVSGATILGDGTVALILDVPALMHDAIEVKAAA